MKLLISSQTIKAETLVNDNVDEMFIRDAIETAQEIHLKQLIGSKLVAKIESYIDAQGQWIVGSGQEYKTLLDDYIHPFLKRRVLADIIVPISFKIRNAGTVQNTAEYISQPSKNDVLYVQEHYANEANFYANRMSAFILRNIADYPEYTQADIDDLRANPRSKDTIIYLQ